ncbi:CusA/CzcA family heavy metal efflux RND transporter [Xanthovirga aplysinae]|uniref:CusA/CzcA family heavy metal efflux RND transporter n=1 Tax=Xanthovirga aplysinae TaxID=2529853 RepID=UPI0031B5B40E
MLEKIIAFSIKNKLIIGVMVLGLIAWGGYSVTQIPIDALPDITNNQVQVITSAPSQSAEDIERLVTFPIEQSMATIPGIDEIRSFSRFGLSVVTVVFEDNIDIYWARQQIGERLSEAESLIPEGVGEPTMAPLTTGLGEIYQYVLRPTEGYEDQYSAMELRTIQDWIVKRQLLGVPGVAEVSSFGGHIKQYEIALNPEKLRSMNIGINEVFEALSKNNQNIGGAYIDKNPNAYFIRSQGLIENLDDIGSILIKRNDHGYPILIRDVATVGFGKGVRYGAMTRNGEGEVVGAVVMMLKGANSSQVIANVKDRIAQVQKSLPEGIELEAFLDRADLVNSAIKTVVTNLTEGALIVIFVLVLFLGNMRAGLVVASVIPLAMLFALSMMNLFGVSGNLMSLGAIDFGLIVDGAVIIVEATIHHLGLRKSGTLLNQQEMDKEVFDSAKKIRKSAAFGEIIILIVYLPILALTGTEGKMFAPMAKTVAFAILGAFILSLTYVPMMSALLLNKKINHKRNISDLIMEKLQKLYTPVIKGALKHPFKVVGSAVGLFLLSLLVFNQLGGVFIPNLDEGDFAVETRVLTGSSISETVNASDKAAKVLLKEFPDEVLEVVGKIGSSEIPTDPMPIEACDLIIRLSDKDQWTKAKTKNELAEKMQAALEQYTPGTSYGFQQPIQMRFNELMTGARQDVVIKIYGEDLDKLTDYAQQLGKLAQTVEGAQDLYIEEVSGLTQIIVDFKRDQIAHFGLSIEEVNRALSTAFAGESAGLVYEGERRFDLVVRLQEDQRQNLKDIENIYITNSEGQQIPLRQLAEVSFKVAPNQIQRDDTKRRIMVGFNVRGRDVKSVVNEIQTKVDQKIKFEAGYYPTYGGTFENLEKAQKRLAIVVPMALLFILLLLYLTFGSMKHSLLIFTAIPMSAIGGIFALWIRGLPFSISAGVGFIALFGVAVLNGIVLIAEFNRLKNEGKWNLDEIILKGTSIRLRPVVMTAVVASLGFLPMALSTSNGAEVQRPLATVVIGGLITATLLTLIVLPILYKYFETMKRTSQSQNAPGVKQIATMIALALTFSTLPFSTRAQESTQTLSLETAFQIMMENNPDLKAAALSTTRYDELKASAFDVGKTDVSLSYGKMNQPRTNDNAISISQSIPFPTVFGKKMQLIRANRKGAKISEEVVKNELLYQLKSIYYQIIYLRSNQSLLEKQQGFLQKALEGEIIKREVGEGTLLQQTTMESQLRSLENQLRQNQSYLEQEKKQLKVLLHTIKMWTLPLRNWGKNLYKELTKTAIGETILNWPWLSSR